MQRQTRQFAIVGSTAKILDGNAIPLDLPRVLPIIEIGIDCATEAVTASIEVQLPESASWKMVKAGLTEAEIGRIENTIIDAIRITVAGAAGGDTTTVTMTYRAATV